MLNSFCSDCLFVYICEYVDIEGSPWTLKVCAELLFALNFWSCTELLGFCAELFLVLRWTFGFCAELFARKCSVMKKKRSRSVLGPKKSVPEVFRDQRKVFQALRWTCGFCAELLGFALNFWVLRWTFGFCAELFGFALNFFGFALNFWVLRWTFGFCAELFSAEHAELLGFPLKFLVFPLIFCLRLTFGFSAELLGFALNFHLRWTFGFALKLLFYRRLLQVCTAIFALSVVFMWTLPEHAFNLQVLLTFQQMSWIFRPSLCWNLRFRSDWLGFSMFKHTDFAMKR